MSKVTKIQTAISDTKKLARELQGDTRSSVEAAVTCLEGALFSYEKSKPAKRVKISRRRKKDPTPSLFAS